MKSRLIFLKKWSVLCISLSFLLIIIQTIYVGSINNIELPPSEPTESDSITFLLAIAILTFTVVPVIEEFLFRGVFFKKKYLALSAFFISAVYVVIFHFHSFSIYLFLPYALLFTIWMFSRKKSRVLFKGLLVSNAIFFQALHVDFSDFNYFIMCSLFILGIGFVFMVQYLFFNYDFSRAVLFHAVWNFIVVAIGVLDLQFPSEEIKNVENEKIRIEWKEAAIFDKKQAVFDTMQHTYKTYLIKDIFPQKRDSISEKITNKYYQTRVDQRYDITIKLKDSSYFNSKKLLIETYNLLEGKGLIERK